VVRVQTFPLPFSVFLPGVFLLPATARAYPAVHIASASAEGAGASASSGSAGGAAERKQSGSATASAASGSGSASVAAGVGSELQQLGPLAGLAPLLGLHAGVVPAAQSIAIKPTAASGKQQQQQTSAAPAPAPSLSLLSAAQCASLDHTLIAHSLVSLCTQLGCKPDLFSLGLSARAVATRTVAAWRGTVPSFTTRAVARMRSLTACPRRTHAEYESACEQSGVAAVGAGAFPSCSIMVVDRSLDLGSAVAHTSDSLMHRVFQTLPPAAGMGAGAGAGSAAAPCFAFSGTTDVSLAAASSSPPLLASSVFPADNESFQLLSAMLAQPEKQALKGALSLCFECHATLSLLLNLVSLVQCCERSCCKPSHWRNASTKGSTRWVLPLETSRCLT
jgi:hypothetical protein